MTEPDLPLLSAVVFQTAKAIDDGYYVPLDEIEQTLVDGETMEFLAENLPEGYLTAEQYFSEAEYATLDAKLRDIHLGVGPEEYGLSNNGLAYIIALVMEAVMRAVTD